MQQLMLKHKNIPVIAFLYNEELKTVEKIIQIYNINRMPPGTVNEDPELTGETEIIKNLARFLRRRQPEYYLLPNNYRTKLDGSNIRQDCDNPSFTDVSDKYWVCEPDDTRQWTDVDPIVHYNLKTDAIYHTLFEEINERIEEDNITYTSINTLRDGFLWNKMHTSTSDIVMVKMYANAITEYRKFKIMLEENFINIAPRQLAVYGEHLFCIVPMELDCDTEAFPLALYYDIYKKDASKNLGTNLLDCCLKLFGNDAKDAIIHFLNEVTKYDTLFDAGLKLEDVYILRDYNTLKILGFRGL